MRSGNRGRIAIGNSTTAPAEAYSRHACALAKRFAAKIASASSGKPILDVACGSGRNAFVLAEIGCTVVCIDRDVTILRRTRKTVCGELNIPPRRLKVLQMDLLEDEWPYGACSVGGIINVHFLAPTLLPLFVRSLVPGGYLLIESVPGCGGNYLQLPRAGEIEAALGEQCDFELYKERKVGPSSSNAVTVKAVTTKRKASRLVC